MTNSEYFEKNKISFVEAMEIFNKQKNTGIKSFDKFLSSERVEHKFKTGDLIVLQLNDITLNCGWKHNVVLKIIEISEFYYLTELLTPDGSAQIGDVYKFMFRFVEDHCVLY